LNTNLEINNERQDCKIGTVGGYLWEGDGNVGNEDVGIRLMGFVYIYI
jgi:hypothetical protein